MEDIDQNDLDATMEMSEEEIQKRLSEYEDLRETDEWKENPNYIPSDPGDERVQVIQEEDVESDAWEAIIRAENETIASERNREQQELEYDVNSEMRRLLGMDFSTGKLTASDFSAPLKKPPSAPLVGNPVDVIRRRKLSQQNIKNLPVVDSESESESEISEADDDVIAQLARIHAEDQTIDLVVDENRELFDPSAHPDTASMNSTTTSKQSLQDKAAARRQRYAADPSQKVVDDFLAKKYQKESARAAAEEKRQRAENEARAARLEQNKNRFQIACKNNKVRESKRIVENTAEHDMQNAADRAKREARAKSRIPCPPSR